MKKKMTKRLLALVLALALCTALMLPGFAATVSEETPYAVCVAHSWSSNRSREAIVERSPARHVYQITIYKTCLSCGEEQIISTTLRPESHPNPCAVCGWYL